MTTYRESLDVQRMVALQRLINTCVIKRPVMQTINGRTTPTGEEPPVNVDPIDCLLRPVSSEPQELNLAERLTTQNASVVLLPIGTDVQAEDKVVVSSVDGWTRTVIVRAILPQRTNATLMKVLAEEIG